MTRWHLPSALDLGRRLGGVMTTACGKRGPIRPREDLGVLPVQTHLHVFDEAPLVCEDCLVAWDAAEESGRLRVYWLQNDKREWRSHGAPLFLEQPTRWGVCSTCHGRHARPLQENEWTGHARHSLVGGGFPVVVVMRDVAVTRLTTSAP